MGTSQKTENKARYAGCSGRSGLNVTVATGSAWARLQNVEERALRCRATFRYGPEVPRTRKALIEPPQAVLLSYRVHRPVVEIRIHVEYEMAS